MYATFRFFESLVSAQYPQAYMNGDNHLLKRIASYEAVYNRIIFIDVTAYIL